MCGRYTLRATPAELAEIFGVFRELDLPPRFNVAPTQDVPIVRETGDGRTLALVRWGLVPSWSKALPSSAPLINCRSETAAEKPSFRTSFRKRRCLVPADGFYEWQEVAPRRKQPYHVRRRDGGPFAFAGLWDRWEPPRTSDASDPQVPPLESCTILTTSANPLMATLHDRMPVVLPPDAWGAWLDPELQDAAALRPLLVPCPPDDWELVPVDPYVNNARHEGPRCLASVSTLF